MAAAFDRDALLDAFDEIGHAAIAAGTRLEIAVYGGSALMLASNFRWATEDVDVSAIEKPWPEWLAAAVDRIAARNRWDRDWFNDSIRVFLDRSTAGPRDHLPLGTFPRNDAETIGLTVHIPTARYMLALKLRALRLNNPVKGPVDYADVQSLLAVAGIRTADEALAIVASYFPHTAGDLGKERFVINHLLKQSGPDHAPSYPVGSPPED